MTSRTLDWRAAILAGLLAGAIFMMLEMIMVPAFAGGSPWGPPRMIAAIVMGEGVLPAPPPPPTFDPGVMMAAVLVHFVLSVSYAVVIAFVVRAMRAGPAALVGLLAGLVLYVVNFYLFTAIFPWFAMARNWVTIFAHLAFGLLAALFYVRFRGEPAVPSQRPAV